MKDHYITSIRKQLEYYKLLGINTFKQVSNKELMKEISEGSNSIAIIVKHMHGNMLSRFTDFLSTDGEKEWRKRDAEFEPTIKSRKEVVEAWEEGWDCVFKAVDSITDLNQIVYIRNQGHKVYEALNRQLAHYAYHVGQIVILGKIFKSEAWTSLSIPKNKSAAYNAEKFSKEKSMGHFTDEYLGK